jgi:hypothetical protein
MIRDVEAWKELSASTDFWGPEVGELAEDEL